MRLTVDANRRVRVEGSVDVPLAADDVWRRMAHAEQFLCMDPLHREVRAVGGERIGPGSAIVIKHRLLGVGPDRVGRMLRWREGRGYVFSDLSARGLRTGFPHVCSYDVAPLGPKASRVTIGARGRWTTAWTPRWLIKAWLWWVVRSTEDEVRLALALGR